MKRRSNKDSELRIKGLGLAARFVVSMTVALLIVVSVAGFTLYRSSTRLAENYRGTGIAQSAQHTLVLDNNLPRIQPEEGTEEEYEEGLTSQSVTFGKSSDEWQRGRLYHPVEQPQDPVELLVHLPHGEERRGKRTHEPIQLEERQRIIDSQVEDFPEFTKRGPWEEGENGVMTRRVEWQTVVMRKDRPVVEDHVGWIFSFPRSPAATDWIVPDLPGESNDSLLRLILVVMILVVLIGAGVAFWVGFQIVRPINEIIDDIRKISKGDLRHKTRVRGAGELELLGRTIDRMTRELQEAQEAELQLGIRNREMEFAEGVREALLPVATPLVEGYDVGAAHLSGHFGGDFHDFIELEDGRLGLLVCDVSGQGVPAALIGATARAFLRRALCDGSDVLEALRAVNRELHRDVRRGMFVTALYALIDPQTAQVQVACAGHKIPLLRYCAADKKLRLIQPDGIALGFDKGPVFDRRLELAEFTMEIGDRLLLANSGPVSIENEAGEELGEKAFYSFMLKAVKLSTPKFLRSIRTSLTEYAGESGSSASVSLVTILRES